MDHMAIMRACVILRGVVRNDPAITGLELAVGRETVIVTSVAVDGGEQCEVFGSFMGCGPNRARRIRTTGGWERSLTG